MTRTSEMLNGFMAIFVHNGMLNDCVISAGNGMKNNSSDMYYLLRVVVLNSSNKLAGN